MKYKVLRNCYVGDRYYGKDDVVVLPDAMEKNEKNFKLMGEPLIEEVKPAIESIEEVVAASSIAPTPDEAKTDTAKEPRELRPSEYHCPKCDSPHRKTSKQGKKHLKYIKEA